MNTITGEMFDTLSSAIDCFRDAIAEAVRSKSKGGVLCPCCDTLHKVYKRTLNSNQAAELIKFYKLAGTEYAHLSILKTNVGGEFAFMRHWGLVEAAPKGFKDDFSGKTSGYWRITGKGVLYIHGRCSIIKYLHILNGRVVVEDGGYATITDAFKDRFDYQELMER